MSMNLPAAPTILSLFDYSGVWSEPYRAAGYNVVRVDIEAGRDVLAIDTFTAMPRPFLASLGRIHGVIVQPPCTEFAGSGARWWADKDPGLLERAERLVGKAGAIIHWASPKWFVFENPVGRLGQRLLGKPAMVFNPNEFAGWADDPAAEAYTKRTCLWGAGWRLPEKRPVAPRLGSKMHQVGESKARMRIRSLTPSGFARAWFNANP